MTDRRGIPIEVISDNGTNFVSGERELRELLSLMDQNKIKHSMPNKGIKWQFNPLRASHFGGFFEALIKSAKGAVAAVLSDTDITDEELLTAFTRAERLLNLRPWTSKLTVGSRSCRRDRFPCTPPLVMTSTTSQRLLEEMVA